MFKIIFILSVLCAGLIQAVSGETLDRLDRAIREKADNDLQKEKRITAIRNRIRHGISPAQEYHLNEMLCDEYQKFRIDSAIRYSRRNTEIAVILRDSVRAMASRLRLSFLYSSSGQYRESAALLEGIGRRFLPDSLVPIYYDAWCTFYNSYASNGRISNYHGIVTAYRDSLLSVLPSGTDKFRLTLAEKELYGGEYTKAEEELLGLLTGNPEQMPAYALATYLLGRIYEKRGDSRLAIEYFARSAIHDLQHSVKDNASMNLLASIFYESGDLNRAYRYAQSAIEDAVACNVQFRTVSMSGLYTIINTAYQASEARSKAQLQIYLLLISILSVVLLLTAVYIYGQMKKVSAIRQELHVTNGKLSAMNAEVTEINRQLSQKNLLLSESNTIKEAYIAHFFDLCSCYIDKMENYRKMLGKKASTKQLDELFSLLKSTRFVENELEELYRNFDTIFISLYPSFVDDFNALLRPEERVVLRPGQILNTELRIFALMRLGITDCVKIAAFLRFSLSTIYNYRTKVRNSTVIPRDEFDKKVLNIGFYGSR